MAHLVLEVKKVHKVSLENPDATVLKVQKELQDMDSQELQVTLVRQAAMVHQAMTDFPELRGKQVLKVLRAPLLQVLKARLVLKVLKGLLESQALQATMEVLVVLDHPASKVQLVQLVQLV